MKNKRTNWAGRVDNVNPDFLDFLSMSMNSAAMQVEIIGILVEVLKEHNLFSSVLHREGSSSYRIAIKCKPEYRLSNITRIRINFNRFNMSLILTDDRGDARFGTFRFRTTVGSAVKCTLTSLVHYATDADVQIIEELKEIFYKTETLYGCNKRRYKELNENIDFNNTTIYELCNRYTSDCAVGGKISRCGYKDMSVVEFAKSVDINALKNRPGIGPKTIAVLNEMYIYYGLDKFKE